MASPLTNTSNAQILNTIRPETFLGDIALDLGCKDPSNIPSSKQSELIANIRKEAFEYIKKYVNVLQEADWTKLGVLVTHLHTQASKDSVISSFTFDQLNSAGSQIQSYLKDKTLVRVFEDIRFELQQYKPPKFKGNLSEKADAIRAWMKDDQNQPLLDHITYLELDNVEDMVYFPPELMRLKNLIGLDLCNNERLIHLPETFSFPKLEELNFSGCARLNRLPEDFNCPQLKIFYLAETPITCLPESLSRNSPLLAMLDLNYTKIKDLSRSLEDFLGLRTLSLHSMERDELDFHCLQITKLELNHSTIPTVTLACPNLVELDLDGSKTTTVNLNCPRLNTILLESASFGSIIKKSVYHSDSDSDSDSHSTQRNKMLKLLRSASPSSGTPLPSPSTVPAPLPSFPHNNPASSSSASGPLPAPSTFQLPLPRLLSNNPASSSMSGSIPTTLGPRTHDQMSGNLVASPSSSSSSSSSS